MPRLTKRVVDAAAPSAKPYYLWDDQIPGFGVKVTPGGQRRYVVKYRVSGGRRGTQRWYGIGAHGAITVDQARTVARDVLARVARGEDPQADRLTRRAAPTMADLWARYATDHLPRKKPSSQRADETLWRLHIEPRLGTTKVAEVTRNQVDRLHRSMVDQPYQANRALALLSKMMNLAELWEYRPTHSNPCRHIPKNKEVARDRYLSHAELQRLGEVLAEAARTKSDPPQIVGAIQLLLLTGARVSEILNARWDQVDLDRRVIVLDDSKTGRRTIFVSKPAIDVLRRLKAIAGDSPYVVKGRLAGQPLINLRKAWRRIRARADLDNVRLHDLRHTAASVAVAQQLGLPIVGRLLGHTQPSTTQRYAHVDLDPALAAADRIGGVITGAMNIDRAVGCLVGLAVGDAVGTTLEFEARDANPPVVDMVGGGPFQLAPGQWTDDTSMALCLAESLISCHGLDPDDLATRFCRWWRDGHNSVTECCFDIGATTSAALARFEETRAPMSGPTDPRSAGNGSIMRLAPIPVYWHDDEDQAAAMAADQSRVTHGAAESVDSCRLLAVVLTRLINGYDLTSTMLPPLPRDLAPRVANLADQAWAAAPRDQIRSSGYVIDTLEAALWAVATTDGFRDAVLTAVNLAGDADTVGAVAGQIAGALYGGSNIPSQWIATLAWSDKIDDLANRLYRDRSGLGAG